MHQFLKFILFWNNTLHVSDGLSFHDQEFKTTYSNRYMSNRYCYLLASGNEMECSSISFPLASRQQYLFDMYLLLYVVLNS